MKKKTEKMEALKNLKVDRKLKKAFSNILMTFIIAVVVVLAGILMINANLKRFYNESYANMQKQLEIRRDIQLVGKNVLWAITSTGDRQEKMEDVVTYAERVEKNIASLEESFSDKEKTAQLDAALKELKTERIKVTDLAEAGETESALTLFNGAYNDATENIQDILLEIGDMADTQAATAYSRATSLVSMVDVLLIVLGVIGVLMCIMWEKRITELLLTPIKELQGAAQKLKAGELDIDITYQSQDELGDLAQNFREACDEMKVVIQDAGELLSRMAEGNFDVHTNVEESYVGDFRLLIDSMRKLNRQLDTTLRKINEATEHVMVGSGQLAGNAQSLAEGATEQSGAVQELMANVVNVASIAENSAESSVEAADRAKESAENAEKSREEMNALTGAMERITATSKEIENIIAAIEDIASQTNLLALNASIEAARAGEAGKGFAVVADQIGKLAADSAESAVSTRALISKSLEEVEEGNQIVVETIKTIASVLEGMEQFAGMVSGVAEASKEQASMLKQVESGIGQISAVVESNSAAAEETSAVSQELSAQAQTLEEMVAQFELREE